VSRVTHLASQFFGSLRPRALDAETTAWVTETLEPEEMYVWEGLGRADRAEAVAVARRLEPSNLNGVVTIPTVNAFSSRAMRATTGAPPEPVPPPSPAATNTMSAPRSACRSWS